LEASKGHLRAKKFTSEQFHTKQEKLKMKKITINSKEYSRTKIKNNILKVYDVALHKEKNDWYQEANDFASEFKWFVGRFNNIDLSVNKILGVVSALSPLKEWSKNKEIAMDLILSGDCGHMKNNKQKALDILSLKGSDFRDGDQMVYDFKIRNILNGDKTKRFYSNMVYPSGGGVTVDRHAIAIAIGRTATEKEQALSSKQYQFLEDCYIMVANQLGLAPLHLQSITWQAWKRIK
jgi:hypothetical protein